MATAPKSPAGAAQFELCPAGVQQLVCCDVIDLGVELSTFRGSEGKPQHKVRLRFQSSLKMSTGKPYLVQRKFTWSMFKTANLRKFMEGWRGRPFSDAEADNFDFDDLIGVNGLGTIAHTQRQGATYADIMQLMGLPSGMQPLTVTDYIRVQDRPADVPAAGDGTAAPVATAATAGAPAAPQAPQPPPHTDDDAHGSYAPSGYVPEDDDDLPF